MVFISRTIKEQSKWVAIQSLDAGSHTPFNRLKRNWLTVYPASITDGTDRINSWSPAGDVLTLVTTHGEPMKIHLDQMKPAVDSLFEELATSLSQLFPNASGLPSEVKWEPQDNLGTLEALVDQADFLKTISPLYIQFSTAMFSPDEPIHQIWLGNKFQAAKFIEWLELEQKVLQTIFLIILFTGGGVSPRTFSIAGLQYRQTPSAKRNLYVHSGVLCFAWPKAKGNSRSIGDVSHSLFSFPSQLNWLLFIYLGIIRKFTIEVLEKQKWSLGQLETFLFVHTGNKKNHGSPWEAYHMNSVLGKFSQSLFGSSFRVSDFRQITQAIYYQHFQGRREMENIMEDTANRMGNHTKQVAHHYYAKIDITSTEDSELSAQAIELCIACSKAWHCWLGLIPYDHMISTKLGPLSILQRQQNYTVAQMQTKIWLLENVDKISPPTNLHDFLVASFSLVRLTSYSPPQILTLLLAGERRTSAIVQGHLHYTLGYRMCPISRMCPNRRFGDI